MTRSGSAGYAAGFSSTHPCKERKDGAAFVFLVPAQLKAGATCQMTAANSKAIGGRFILPTLAKNARMGHPQSIAYFGVDVSVPTAVDTTPWQPRASLVTIS